MSTAADHASNAELFLAMSQALDAEGRHEEADDAFVKAEFEAALGLAMAQDLRESAESAPAYADDGTEIPARFAGIRFTKTARGLSPDVNDLFDAGINWARCPEFLMISHGPDTMGGFEVVLDPHWKSAKTF